MKKMQPNIRYLYLSPIDFKDLAIVFDKLIFEIKLLLAYKRNGDYAPVVFTPARISKEFSLLNKNSTITEIQNLLIEQNLELSEFELVSGFKLKSIIGNDVLLELKGDDSIDFIIHKVMTVWQLPNTKYSEHDVELIKPNFLFEINPKTGTPKTLLKNIRYETELVDYLYNSWLDGILPLGDYEPRCRISFLTQRTTNPISV